MASDRYSPPERDGEILCAPAFAQWEGMAERTARAAEAWPEPLRDLRVRARAESIEVAARYSRSIGLAGRASATPLIVMTGHQPEFYHPGVWVKNFLLQRLTGVTRATGVNLVVDTDLAGHVSFKAPCAGGRAVCHATLEQAGIDVAYVDVPVPDAAARAKFRGEVEVALGSLAVEGPGRNFGAFADALEEAAADAPELATLMTRARRVLESAVGASYLELPLSLQAAGGAYREFVATVLTDAGRFRQTANAALAEYRVSAGIRSTAQPFADLGATAGRIEVPFWLLRGGRRLPVTTGDGRLWVGGEAIADLGGDATSAARSLEREGLLLAPKAMALTLFERLFVADLFVHGTGGARYDRVTDRVISDYYGIEPPAYAVASMTLLVPLPRPEGAGENVAELERRLQRLEHNPDEFLDEAVFETPADRAAAHELVARKRALVEAVSRPDADRKELGRAIREANEKLNDYLRPVKEALGTELARQRADKEACDILTDRTYPFCLWDPAEIAERVRWHTG